ncbi:hypothetical protein BJF78_30655 [Pseudonocardia sp. CNS-139]|nr:hypothetical protein BJF78_30655 [Pseudonocardia sp. CNS-139]
MPCAHISIRRGCSSSSAGHRDLTAESRPAVNLHIPSEVLRALRTNRGRHGGRIGRSGGARHRRRAIPRGDPGRRPRRRRDRRCRRCGLGRGPAAAPATALTALADLVERRADEVAALITREEGKPLPAARGEAGKAAEQFRLAAQLAYLVEGTTYPQETAGTFAYTLRSPLGVVVAITPWNFPLSLAARKIAPALAAGNTVVFKPSPVTAGVGQWLADAAAEAGVPDGVLNIVHGHGPDA